MEYLSWVIVYSDKSTFSNLDGAWEDAPGRDVQVVLFRDKTLGWTMRHGAKGGSRCDFFRLDKDGSCVGMDLAGMIDHAICELNLAGWGVDLVSLIYVAVHQDGAIKQGRMLSQAHWDNVHRFALELRNGLREADNGST